MEEMTQKLFDLEYQGKISHEQNYRLKQLYEEGYDISAGLEIYVEDPRHCCKLSEKIKNGATAEELKSWLKALDEAAIIKEQFEDYVDDIVDSGATAEDLRSWFDSIKR